MSICAHSLSTVLFAFFYLYLSNIPTYTVTQTTRILVSTSSAIMCVSMEQYHNQSRACGNHVDAALCQFFRDLYQTRCFLSSLLLFCSGFEFQKNQNYFINPRGEISICSNTPNKQTKTNKQHIKNLGAESVTGL